MASLCDFTRDDGTVSRDQAVAASTAQSEGRLSRDAAVAIIEAYNTGSTIDQCVSETDESTASASVNSLTSPSPNTIQLAYSVTNTVTSGDGATLFPVVEVSVDGTTIQSTTVTVSPGESKTVNREITEVASGEREICVDVR